VTARGRRPASRRQPPRRRGLRTVSIILLFFAGIGLLVILAAGGLAIRGPAASIRGFFFYNTGFLGFLVPVLLLLCSIRLLKPTALPGAFSFVHGLAVTLYFLAALTDMIGRRINPALAWEPGGAMAGRAVDVLSGWMGPLPAYLALLMGFVLSLIVFTGWDIAGDLASVPVRLPRLPARSPRPQPGVVIPTPSGSSAHNWIRKREEGPPHDVPSFLPDARDAVPAAVLESPGEPPDDPRERRGEPAALPAHVRTDGTPVDASAERTAEPGTDSSLPAPPGRLPPDSVLMSPPATSRSGVSESELRERAGILVSKLSEFGVACEIVDIKPGPVLTRFELRPGPGVRVNSIVGRSDDLALAMKARRIRILAPIPGRDAVGIEVPNPVPDTVFLREILRTVSGETLPIALGRRMEGDPIVADIADMPHLLVAGATGQGKSVCLHSIICTLLMKKRPDEVRLALIDPKQGAELKVYEDLPHLWAPVVCDARVARLLLEDLVNHMESRYAKFSRNGVRSIAEYNREIAPEGSGAMPYIVLIIDELADLMTTSASEIEQPIVRLAQMARAVGIHLVVATQRPSVDVITGIIKANFPSRIAFMVSSKTDSRTILDMNGAEALLGRGDMLFLPSSSPEPIRIQGSLVTDREIKQIVGDWRQQDLPYQYCFEPATLTPGNISGSADLDSDDALLQRARDIVVRYQIGSTSLLQRKLKLGFSRAGRIMDLLEEKGVVGPSRDGRAREVLVSREDAGMTSPSDGPQEGGA